MKTGFFGLLCLFMLGAQPMAFARVHPTEVNEKLIRAFHDAFPRAERVDWKENENSYTVSFSENKIRSQIEYDLEGNFLSAVRYYQDPNLLPLRLAWQLHKKFAGKTIFGVTETTSASSQVVYYVKLEGEGEWITVKANANGGLKLIERLPKQS